MDLKTQIELAAVIIALCSLALSGYAVSISRRNASTASRAADSAATSATAARENLEIARQSVSAANRSASSSEEAASASIAMFKRQGIFELNSTWRDIHAIDGRNPITRHVIEATNALEITAAVWNHGILEQLIIHQVFWPRFKEICDTLKNSDTIVPQTNTRCRDFISVPVAKVYDQLYAFDKGNVTQTTV